MYEVIIPWVLLILVNLSLIIRRIGKLEVPAWAAFMFAAIILLNTENYSIKQAEGVILSQINVFFFLFGMFVLVNALEQSGLLEYLSVKLLSRTGNQNRLLFAIVFGFGLSASLLINDTIAILGPIVLIKFAGLTNRNKKADVLAVAYAVSFGSALFLTGNPQNFILASAGGVNFLEFAVYAAFPTLIALTSAYFFIRKFVNGNHTSFAPNSIQLPEVKNPELGKWALISLGLVFVGLLLSPLLGLDSAFVILSVSAVFLFFRNERDEILGGMNWGIFIFFAGMFVVIDAVTHTTVFRTSLIPWVGSMSYTFPSFVLFVSMVFVLSQVFSNVPVAVLLAGIMPGTAIDHPLFWVGAAVVSTFAGATTIMGAASNIIVLETARKEGVKISWLEFSKYGVPMSILALLGTILFAGILFLSGAI